MVLRSRTLSSALVAAALAAPAGGGAALAQPLPHAAVACDANRLAAIARRTVVETRGAPAHLQLAITTAGPVAGLAVRGAIGEPETHLAFTLDTALSELLRNPERPPLPTWSIVRNEPASDLTDRDGAPPLAVTVDPLLGAGPAASRLTVDNRDGGIASRSRPGRGLEGLGSACHDELGDDDRRGLEILVATVRAEVEGAWSTTAAIFRDAEPDRYRIDVLARTADGSPLGQLSARVELVRDGSGRPGEAVLRLLEPCAGARLQGCTSLPLPGRIVLLAPAGRGEAPRIVAQASLEPGQPAGIARFAWADVAAGTGWQPPPVAAGPAPPAWADGPLVWVAAHPDDEILVAPLLAELCLSLDTPCTLAVATRGEAGPCKLPDGCRPDLATVREDEMRQAAARLGARLVQGRLPDAAAPDPDGVLAAWAAAEGGAGALAATLREVMVSAEARTVITFDPRHGATGHSDHRAVGALAIEVAATLDPRPRVLLLETAPSETSAGFSFRPAGVPEPLVEIDATRPLVRPEATGWERLLDVVAAHPSQFDPHQRAALAAVPATQRRVWLLECEAGDADSLPPCPAGF